MKSLLPILFCIALCGCFGTAVLEQPPEPETQIVIQQVQPAPAQPPAADFTEKDMEKPHAGWPSVLIISAFMLMAPAVIIKMKGL